MGESFGDIFFGNATALGMPCVAVARGDLDALAKQVGAQPATLFEVDLASRSVRAGDGHFPLSMPAATHRALMEGAWDPIAGLLVRDGAIRATTARLEYLRWADARTGTTP